MGWGKARGRGRGRDRDRTRCRAGVGARARAMARALALAFGVHWVDVGGRPSPWRHCPCDASPLLPLLPITPVALTVLPPLCRCLMSPGTYRQPPCPKPKQSKATQAQLAGGLPYHMLGPLCFREPKTPQSGACLVCLVHRHCAAPKSTGPAC